ncbi:MULTISPECIES: hypothetical protein [Flavobacterium]|uniref:hypothetical protein n=1 Tax=Flavobacterium TaxID=237 RepID=UPI001FCCA04C|nr:MULTISPECIES: hypothetical protein [Flavobacterium]UOK42059.1 hypothetical protein LZF87_12170 [Flavobacterium enshiense]
MDDNFEVIDKERISSLTFPNTDVLDGDKEAIKQRKEELDRALTLGNLEHHKIKIYFEDDKSKKMVDTTIWGLAEERIILKQGVVIPINRIYKTV